MGKRRYNHIIEDWWRHQGAADRMQITGITVYDVQELFRITDEWWSSRTEKEKVEVYNDFFSDN